MFEYLIMVAFTVIGIKYLVDMIKFALGYEINGKKREPVITLPKKRVPVIPEDRVVLRVYRAV